MIVQKSLLFQYLVLHVAETGLYVYYAHDILKYYYSQHSTGLILNIYFSELSFASTRVLCILALGNTVLNDSLESFYVFLGLKLIIFILLILEIPLHHFKYVFLIYMVPLVAQVVFVVVNYDTIIRNALWKYYKSVGSSPTVQNAHNVSQSLTRFGRFCVWCAFSSMCTLL